MTDSRGFSVGNPLKTRSASGSQRSFTNSPAMRSRAEIRGAPSPGRAMAMGDFQRGRSLSRHSSGRQIMGTSNTPGRRRSAGGGVAASPGDSGGGGRYSYDGRGVSRTPGRGRQMYDRSNSTPTWDERRGGARAGSSRSPGMAVMATRPKSMGRVRRPPTRPLSVGAPGDELGREDEGGRPRSTTPGRRSLSSRSGRSMSERSGRHPSLDWAREEEEEERRREEDEYDLPRWEDRHAGAGGLERGRRSQRSMAKSRSMHDVSLSERDSMGRYDSQGRGRSRSRGRSGTPTREQVQYCG